jgi:hypothetical protein
MYKQRKTQNEKNIKGEKNTLSSLNMTHKYICCDVIKHHRDAYRRGATHRKRHDALPSVRDDSVMTLNKKH